MVIVSVMVKVIVMDKASVKVMERVRIMSRKIGAETGIDISKINSRENYLLAAAVVACVYLMDKHKKCKKHSTRRIVNKRRATERLQRALKLYQLSSSQVDFYCMRTTADYDFKPSGPGN
jgi:hypothetical protein